MNSHLRRGVTLIEVVIAAALTIIIAGGIYGLLSATRHTATVAKAKGELKNMAEVILRQLEKDISTSRAKVTTVGSGSTASPTVTTDFQPTGNGWTMIVPEGMSWMKVDYEVALPNLTRTASNTNRLLCKYVKKLNISKLSVEQWSIDLEVELVPEGMTKPLSHQQTLLVTIREAVTANLDPRWRNTEDVVDSY